MSVALVIVSHSQKLAEGVVDLAGQMNGGHVRLLAAGGTEDGLLGTSAVKIHAALAEALAEPDGHALILMDLGSAYLSSTMALEFLSEEERQRVQLAEAPLVEGAFLAAFEAASGSSLTEVRQAAESGRDLKKMGE